MNKIIWVKTFRYNIYTGLARNKFPTLEGSRMRSTGPNEIKFELQEIQMMRLTFIRLKKAST